MILDLGWALNSIPDSLIRRGKGTESQKSNVKMEAAWSDVSTGKCQGFPEVTRISPTGIDRMFFSLESPEGMKPANSWLSSSGLLNCEIINSCCFRPPNSVVIIYDTSRKLMWLVTEAMGKSVLECLTWALKVQLKVVCLLPTHNSLARTIHTASCKLEGVRKCNPNRRWETKNQKYLAMTLKAIPEPTVLLCFQRQKYRGRKELCKGMVMKIDGTQILFSCYKQR